MEQFDALLQEMARGGKMVRLNASRREIAKIRQGLKKPVHRTPLPRFIQHTKEQPKRSVRNVTKGATPMVSNRRIVGEKLEPWNK